MKIIVERVALSQNKIKEELDRLCIFSEFEKSWIMEQIEDD